MVWLCSFFFIAGVVYHGEVQEPSDALCWIYLGAGTALVWIYFVGLECSMRQATWGMQAMEIRVISLEGGRLSFRAAASRFMLAFFLFIATFGISFLIIFFTRRKQAMHDKIAGSLVVKE